MSPCRILGLLKIIKGERRRVLRKNILILLGIAALVFIPVYQQAPAIPMQRTVTVVDNNKQVILRENILYNNTYNQPEIKIPVNNTAVITSGSQPARQVQLASRAAREDVRLVLKKASELLGSAYKYHASGPNAFDCSGFTMYVYRSVGVNLPHNAAEQYKSGMKVSRSELAPGDLVFFGYYGSHDIRHVGIYAGNGLFIHSSTKHGVIETPLDSPYYASNYKGAVRILR